MASNPDTLKLFSVVLTTQKSGFQWAEYYDAALEHVKERLAHDCFLDQLSG